MQQLQKKMQKFLLIILIMSIQLFIMQNVFAASLSPIGLWQTIDDKTNKPRSIVQIWQQGDELRGKIVKVYYQPGESEKDVCIKCKGPLHNQLILGMTFLWGMKPQNDNEWASGKILDPKNGKVYKCKMSLSTDGQQLKVRGYIGTPLLGRSQIWLRKSDNKIGQ